MSTGSMYTYAHRGSPDPFERALARVEAEERIASRVRVVATFQLLLGGLGLGVAALVGGVLGGVGLLSADPGSVWLTGLGALLGSLGAAISTPAVLGGIGLLRRRAWARRLVVVLAAIELCYVPIGTVLGGATLAVLLPDAARRYFEGSLA